MRNLAGVLAMAAACGFGCGPSGAGPDGGGGGGQDSAPGPDDEFADGGADASCGAQQEDIGVVNLGPPPDLLIVLDKSGSMLLPPNFPFPDPSKWDLMKGALSATTDTFDQNIRFGLLLFPTDDLCAVAPGARVPIDLGQSANIVAALNGSGPSGSTPSHFALTEALAIYQSIPVNPDGRYVLFATDGLPNCNGGAATPDEPSDAATIAAVEALATAGIKTFVLGFGNSFVTNAQVLNDAALAGEVPKPGGPPHYYYATNQAELEQTFTDIAGGIIVPSCSFALEELPPDPDLVTVTLNGTAVPRDAGHQNGWDYHPDAGTITFFGSYCEMIEAGASSSVGFSYGCPGPVVD
jgi:hypothetical protein